MIWHPLKDDVGALDGLLTAAARAVVGAHPSGGPDAPLWQTLALEDGRLLQLRLSAVPRQRITHGLRAALAYAVAGQAVIGTAGFACSGSVVVDLKTRAFLDVRCALTALGPVERA